LLPLPVQLLLPGLLLLSSGDHQMLQVFVVDVI
jgi:hypothetical protein